MPQPKTTIEVEGKGSEAAKMLDEISARLKKVSADAVQATESIQRTQKIIDASGPQQMTWAQDKSGKWVQTAQTASTGTRTNNPQPTDSRRGGLATEPPTLEVQEDANEKKKAEAAARAEAAKKAEQGTHLAIAETLQEAAQKQAAGDTKGAEALRLRAKEMQYGLQLQKQAGLSEDEALDMASRRIEAERAAHQAKKESLNQTKLENEELKKREGLMGRLRTGLTSFGARAAGAGRAGGMVTAAEQSFGIGAVGGIAIGGAAIAATLANNILTEAHERRLAHEDTMREIDNERRARAGASADVHLSGAARLVDKIALHRRALNEETSPNFMDGPFKWIGHQFMSLATGGTRDMVRNIQGNIEEGQMGIQKNTDIAEAIRLGRENVEITRLESVGLSGQADLLRRKMELTQKIAEIRANKALTTEEQDELIKQTRDLDRFAHVLPPQVGIGDSLTAAGGGGGVFIPGAGEVQDPLMDVNNNLLGNILSLIDQLVTLTGQKAEGGLAFQRR